MKAIMDAIREKHPEEAQAADQYVDSLSFGYILQEVRFFGFLTFVGSSVLASPVFPKSCLSAVLVSFSSFPYFQKTKTCVFWAVPEKGPERGLYTPLSRAFFFPFSFSTLLYYLFEEIWSIRAVF